MKRVYPPTRPQMEAFLEAYCSPRLGRLYHEAYEQVKTDDDTLHDDFQLWSAILHQFELKFMEKMEAGYEPTG